MKTLIIYFVTVLISYVATIPPGPLSVFVVHTTLQSTFRKAIWVAIGGVLCESTYAYFATKSVGIFNEYPLIAYWMQWVVIALLFMIGIVTFLQKNTTVKHQNAAMNGNMVSFLKGISLSLFNPQLLPFWVVILLSYQKYTFLHLTTDFEKVVFVLGAGSGTFLLTLTYAFIAEKQRKLVFDYITDARLNKIIGVIFIGLGCLQLGNILMAKPVY